MDDDIWTIDQWLAHKREVHRLRREEGRCVRCSAFDGPTHRCPYLQMIRNHIRNDNGPAKGEE